MGWLDSPFFDLVEQFSSIQGYFLAQAMFIAKIVLTINLGFICIKYAIKGSEIKEPIIKMVTSIVIFLIVLNIYPTIMPNLNKIIFQWSYNSTYGEVAKMIDRITAPGGEYSSYWEAKLSPENRYSDIIKQVKNETGDANVAKTYVLDIFEKDSEKRLGSFIRPNAIMRVLMLTFEQIFNNGMEVMVKGIEIGTVFGNPIMFPNYFGALAYIVSAAAVLICGIFAALQYYICALEFTLIMSVGCLMLPFMLWDGTKFLTEKLVSAMVGFFMKMLFVTIAMLLTINGFLGLMVRPFSGGIDQLIYTVFVSLFYMMICQNGPALAVSLLTGSPQMSLMEGVQAAAVLGGAAAVAASGGAKAAVAGNTALDKAQGAFNAAKEDGAGTGGAMKAAARSLGTSAKEGLQNVAHSAHAKLTGGNTKGSSPQRGGGGGGGGSEGAKEGTVDRKGETPVNRFSSVGARNALNADGQRKTSREFQKENNAIGAQQYQAQKAKDALKAQKPTVTGASQGQSAQIKNHPPSFRGTQLLPPPKQLTLPPPTNT